jgi:hypothetical protein
MYLLVRGLGLSWHHIISTYQPTYLLTDPNIAHVYPKFVEYTFKSFAWLPYLSLDFSQTTLPFTVANISRVFVVIFIEYETKLC